MKYLNKYNKFKSINEDWLSDKMSNASDGIKNALSEFTKPFNDAIKNVKGEWKDEFDAESVRTNLIDIITKSFSSVSDSIDKMDNMDDIEQLYDDVQQALVQFNDRLSKEINSLNVSESIKTYQGYFSYNEAQKSTLAALKVTIDSVIEQAKNLIDESREKYLKTFEIDKNDTEEKGLDTIKEESKDFFKKLSKTIENDIKGLDIQKISDEAKAKIETENSANKKAEKEYKPGIILKYTKKDGDENDAEVANNQEDVEDGFINMISLDGKDKFVINRERIVGEANEEGDVEVTPDDITNSLEDIKSDTRKMNKLKKFIENELE